VKGLAGAGALGVEWSGGGGDVVVVVQGQGSEAHTEATGPDAWPVAASSCMSSPPCSCIDLWLAGLHRCWDNFLGRMGAAFFWRQRLAHGKAGSRKLEYRCHTGVMENWRFSLVCVITRLRSCTGV